MAQPHVCKPSYKEAHAAMGGARRDMRNVDLGLQGSIQLQLELQEKKIPRQEQSNQSLKQKNPLKPKRKDPTTGAIKPEREAEEPSQTER